MRMRIGLLGGIVVGALVGHGGTILYRNIIRSKPSCVVKAPITTKKPALAVYLTSN